LSQKQTEIFTFAFYYGCQWALEFHLFYSKHPTQFKFQVCPRDKISPALFTKKNLKKKDVACSGTKS
jgi:hypothetical protein